MQGGPSPNLNRLMWSLFLLYACQQFYQPIVVDAFGITHSSSLNSQLMMAQAETTSEESSAIISCETIDGISSPTLLDNYDTFLLDMWGGEYWCMYWYMLRFTPCSKTFKYNNDM